MDAASSLSAVGKRDRAILETLYGTGLRVAECVKLDLRDVDLSRGTVFVRQGKGKKDRVVPIAGQGAAALDLYLKEARGELVRDGRQHAIFASTTYGRRLGTDAVLRIIRTHAKRAGLTVNVSPHVLRYTYATHLIHGGADVRHVQKLLGHSCLSSTAIHTRVHPKDLAQVLQRAHPRERTWARKRRKRQRK